MENSKSHIVKAIFFRCWDCNAINVQEPLWEKKSDETGYITLVDYMFCKNCGASNRIMKTPDEWGQRL